MSVVSVIRCARFVALTAVMCLSGLVANSQRLDKIYALLNAGAYDACKTELNRSLAKHPDDPALHFAQARYFFEADNPKRHTDSAKVHARRAGERIGLVEKRGTLKRNNALGIRKYHIEQLNIRIDAEAFEYADSVNTVNAWNHFLAVYNDAPQFAEAKARRNRLAFMEISNKYDLTSFERFLHDYPDAAEAGKARELYDRLLYLKQTRDSTWQAYKQFADRYPENPHAGEARANYERLLYADKTKDGSLESFATFVSAFPASPYRARAEDSVYRKATRPSTVANLDAFVKRYAKNPNVPEAWQRLYTLHAVDGSNASVVRFLKQYPSFPFRNDALRDTVNNNKHLVQFESVDGLYGYKDSLTNDVTLQPVFWELSDYVEGFAAGTPDDCDEGPCHYGYYDRSGRERIAPRYTEANPFHQGVAIVAVGDCGADSCAYGLINRLGEYVAPPVYGAILPFENGLALARRDSLYGFLNRDGRAAIPFRYPDANGFAEGLASVFDTTWKVIDTLGNVVVAGDYSKLISFSEGLCAAADTNGLWGFIDRSGKWAIEPQYLGAEPFREGKAKVFVNAAKKPDSVKLPKEKYIDRNGKAVPSPR